MLTREETKKLNYKMLLSLLHAISLHNIILCYLIVKASLETISQFHTVINKCLSLKNTISFTYKRNKNLREILSPPLFPRTAKQNEYSIEEFNSKCDICKSFLKDFTDFTCFSIKRKYKMKGILKCDSRNITYLIS